MKYTVGNIERIFHWIFPTLSNSLTFPNTDCFTQHSTPPSQLLLISWCCHRSHSQLGCTSHLAEGLGYTVASQTLHSQQTSAAASVPSSNMLHKEGEGEEGEGGRGGQGRGGRSKVKYNICFLHCELDPKNIDVCDVCDVCLMLEKLPVLCVFVLQTLSVLFNHRPWCFQADSFVIASSHMRNKSERIVIQCLLIKKKESPLKRERERDVLLDHWGTMCHGHHQVH